MGRQYMSTREVARLLGVSRQTLYNWMKNGKVPGPAKHPLTSYLQWRAEDVDRVRNIMTGAEE